VNLNIKVREPIGVSNGREKRFDVLRMLQDLS